MDVPPLRLGRKEKAKRSLRALRIETQQVSSSYSFVRTRAHESLFTKTHATSSSCAVAAAKNAYCVI
jgi:hypothetical protein